MEEYLGGRSGKQPVRLRSEVDALVVAGETMIHRDAATIAALLDASPPERVLARQAVAAPLFNLRPGLVGTAIRAPELGS